MFRRSLALFLMAAAIAYDLFLSYTLRDARPGFRVVYALLPGAPPPQGTRFLEEMRQRKEGGARRPGGPR